MTAYKHMEPEGKAGSEELIRKTAVECSNYFFTRYINGRL